MTDKERLEDIRAEVEQMAYTSPLNFEKTRINKESALWLIEQVERVQDLKIMLKVLGERNQRYKQALEFYADEEHYKEKLISEAQYDADGICISNDEYAPPIIYFDSGEKARQALEETE